MARKGYYGAPGKGLETTYYPKGKPTARKSLMNRQNQIDRALDRAQGLRKKAK